ncbi:DUF4302 domain-containing protein [Saccharicrinis aurantiacus]|uniref:DUF4302 domain-containing protein n=1 Tax=Saccharicrinis aurantiacus TaxID=1849719 RepID=UPI00249044F0|nr:DUF4302 domain-containing protein [Saccharicrinis aurantiacus]
MINKYIKFTAYLLALLGLIVSCVPEAEDVFELSALQRAQEHRDACYNTLVSAENGWVVQYYPESKYYGGYTFLMKFTDKGRVIMTSEEAFQEETTNSTFRVHSGQSTVLSFDTYAAIHYLADAEALTPKYKGQDLSEIELTENPFVSYGSGYQGDFEFVCDSISDDYVQFKSLKRKTRVEFTKLKNSSVEDYIKAQTLTSEILEEKAREGLFISYQGTDIELTYDVFHRFNKYGFDETGAYTASAMPFVVTTNSIKLYTPVKIGGIEVSEFFWNEDEDLFKSEEGVSLVQGKTARAEFTNPADYKAYWINMKLSSQAFLEDISNLEKELYVALENPNLFGGVKRMRLLMNAYPTAQAYFGGSHRIDVFTEVADTEKSNLYLIGTTAMSMTATSFNYGANFGDGYGGTAGYAPFHNLVSNWLYHVLYKPNVYEVEVEERWSLGERYTNIKLIRNDNPNYYITLELE